MMYVLLFLLVGKVSILGKTGVIAHDLNAGVRAVAPQEAGGQAVVIVHAFHAVLRCHRIHENAPGEEERRRRAKKGEEGRRRAKKGKCR